MIDGNVETALRELGFGYRAAFLQATLQNLREKFGAGAGDIEAGLRSWRAQDLDEVRQQLIQLKGVGRKVADCVMLMSMDKVSRRQN